MDNQTLLLDNITDTLTLKRLPETFKYNILWSSEKINSDKKFAILHEAALRRSEIFKYKATKNPDIIKYRQARKIFYSDNPNDIGYRNVDLKEIWQMIDNAYPDSLYFPELVDK